MEKRRGASQSVWGALTQPHRLVAYKQHSCVAHSSGGWKSDQVPAGSGHRYLLPTPGRRDEIAVWSFICKGTHPAHKGLSTSHKPHLLMPSFRGLGYEFWGDTFRP